VRELALTGRNFGSEEALQFGFVSKVVQGGFREVQGQFPEAVFLKIVDE
jgi:enoyl-CoA hydratase/carnithine racemase